MTRATWNQRVPGESSRAVILGFEIYQFVQFNKGAGPF